MAGLTFMFVMVWPLGGVSVQVLLLGEEALGKACQAKLVFNCDGRKYMFLSSPCWFKRDLESFPFFVYKSTFVELFGPDSLQMCLLILSPFWSCQ